MTIEIKNKPIELELCYGMREGEVIHISEVKSGILQNCLCPKCGTLLIAKKGDIRKHHFAHYNYENCQGAQETALHLLAKDILYQEKCVCLPHLPGTPATNIKSFDQVSLEVRELGLVFDALGYADNEKLAIEIKVTHEIDERKRQIVINHGIQMIEIDLSDYLSSEKNRPEIVEAVINSAPRYWINPLPAIEQKIESIDMINKATIAGFKLASGYSRKNSCNFESNKIFVLQPVENKSSANYQVSACGGYELLQLDMVDQPKLIEKLSTFTFPVEATLTVETAFQRNKCLPVVTDVNLI
ncbi:MAG: competence protein CoiA family protein [Methylobacter sp.]|nr:competence protein CoiA family protein [Methylobacter sp.]